MSPNLMPAAFNTPITGNSLAVQWLGLHAFTAGAWVQSLVRELRSPKPRGAAKKKNTPVTLITYDSLDGKACLRPEDRENICKTIQMAELKDAHKDVCVCVCVCVCVYVCDLH